MPKTKIEPRPSTSDLVDIPTWDALVAELGDPTTHESIVILPSFVVPDDAFHAEKTAYDSHRVDLDRGFDDLISDLDDLDEYAAAALDEVWPWPDVADDEGTIVGPALAQLDVESTLVLPTWPTTTTDEDAS